MNLEAAIGGSRARIRALGGHEAMNSGLNTCREERQRHTGIRFGHRASPDAHPVSVAIEILTSHAHSGIGGGGGRSMTRAKSKRPWLAWITLILVALFTYEVQAQTFQDANAIRSAVRTAALGPNPLISEGADLEIRLDDGLRLPQCASELQSRANSPTTIEVACPGGWKLFVPVRVRRMQPVVVSTRPIRAGMILDEASMRIEMRDMTQLPAETFADPHAVLGKQAARSLAAGRPLTAHDVKSPVSIQRGDTLTLVARSGSVVVRSPGIALSNAALHDVISVKNIGSNRVLQGVVRRPGEVELGW